MEEMLIYSNIQYWVLWQCSRLLWVLIYKLQVNYKFYMYKDLSIYEKLWYIHFSCYFIVLICYSALFHILWWNVIKICDNPLQLKAHPCPMLWQFLETIVPVLVLKWWYNYFCSLPFYLILQQMSHHLFIFNFCYVHCMGRLIVVFSLYQSSQVRY